MFGGQYTTRIDGIVVPARSKADIAGVANLVRKHLGLDQKAFFPVMEVYEALDLLYEDARFEPREIHEMGEDHGRTYPDRNLIHIREDVYERADDHHPRDRFTMCHELGHLMLHRNVALSRIDPMKPPKIFRNSEWQADTFASHLLMPSDLLDRYHVVESVMDAFGVSSQAAAARLSKKAP
jgi:hypothetical protein